MPSPSPASSPMRRRVLVVLLGILLVAPRVVAQQQTITGTVTDERSAPLPNVSVIVKGTSTTSWTGRDGTFAIRAVAGQLLQFRLIGRAQVERTVGDAAVIDVQLKQIAVSLDAVVVTALGQTTEQRAPSSAQQTLPGASIAQTPPHHLIHPFADRAASRRLTTPA